MEEELEVDDSCIKFGRGPSTYNHAGNVKFRSIIIKHLPSYKASPKPVKTWLVNTVHQDILEEGMKFIELKAGIWKELLDNEVTRKKVAHQFRDAIALERKQTICSGGDQQMEPDAETSPPLSTRDSSTACTTDSTTDSTAATTGYTNRESISFSSNDEAMIPEQGTEFLSIHAPTKEASPPEKDAPICGDDGGSNQHSHLLASDMCSEYATTARGSQFAPSVPTSLITMNAQTLAQQPSHMGRGMPSIGMLSDAGIGSTRGPALAAIFDEVTDLVLMEAASLDNDYSED
mmetsp:Transcript_24225/g.40129  ORF Transcript_24225/g.40129 Transcript_24225/m.40129 type:complete len:290 (+) Transcript_24225:247-1116(+)